MTHNFVTFLTKKGYISKENGFNKAHHSPLKSSKNENNRSKIQKTSFLTTICVMALSSFYVYGISHLCNLSEKYFRAVFEENLNRRTDRRTD